MNMQEPQVHAAGGGYGPPPGGYGAPPPGGYGQAPGGYGPPGGPMLGPPPGGAPMAPPGGGPMPGGGGDKEALKKQALMWLIISFLCAGCIVAPILAFLGMQAADKGDLEDARKKIKLAKIITFVMWGLYALLTILYAILALVVGFN
ncbi:MAG: hypothetical protein IT376_15640 [Polyangiaceae bacterium]|nr:hypothetical protein [Polyangiaceae bacterium]